MYGSSDCCELGFGRFVRQNCFVRTPPWKCAEKREKMDVNQMKIKIIKFNICWYYTSSWFGVSVCESTTYSYMVDELFIECVYPLDKLSQIPRGEWSLKTWFVKQWSINISMWRSGWGVAWWSNWNVAINIVRTLCWCYGWSIWYSIYNITI